MVEIVPPPLRFQRSGGAWDWSRDVRFRGLGSVKTFLEWSDRYYTEVTYTLLDRYWHTAARVLVGPWTMVIIAAAQPPLRPHAVHGWIYM